VNGRVVVHAVKGAGFGELALLYDAPRAATVTATSPVEAWVIDRMTFRQVVVGTTMRKREVYAAFLSSVPILSTLTTGEINNVSDALQAVSRPPLLW
jgi:cAMP-dependent protein kinase regulator